MFTSYFPFIYKSYQASQEIQGAAEISWNREGEESIAHCKFVVFTFLPFTFLPFEEDRDGGPGRGKLTLRLLGGGGKDS